MMRMCGMRRLLGKGGGKRKGEAESGAAPGRVVHPDSLIVRFDECLCDHEPEPDAGVVASAGKQFEDLVTSLRADTGTLVRHRDLDEMFLRQCGAHRNGLGFRTVTYGVFEQVREHPTDQNEVDVDRWQAILNLRAYEVTTRGNVIDGRNHDIGDRRNGTTRLKDASLNSAHVEEILHELGKTISLHINERRKSSRGVWIESDLGIDECG